MRIYLKSKSAGNYADFSNDGWDENSLEHSSLIVLIYSYCKQGDVSESIVSKLFPRPGVNPDTQNTDYTAHSEIWFLL